MYHPTSRVLAVLELLQSHQHMTGKELARRLEINIRTLRRYITTLQDLGIPILAERGRNGAYELGTGFRVPPMMFTNEEALALEIGLIAASQLGFATRAYAIESARAKLEHIMPVDLKTRAHAVGETIRLDLSAQSFPPASQTMLVMSSATQEQRRVHFCYKSRSDAETERDIDPYGIAFRRGKWYVVGWCCLRQALRSFRLDRVVEAYVTDICFERSAEFDALRHVEQSIATLPRQFAFEILLKTDMLTAQREILGVYGILEPHEAGVLMRGSTDDLPCLARQMASYSFGFVVHEPVELRQVIREHAAALARWVDAEA
jgi:predicted DNA-binding transcriptional regulator YafY